MEFNYFLFARMPGGVTVGDSGLSHCVPCRSNAISSLCLLIQMRQEISKKKRVTAGEVVT